MIQKNWQELIKPSKIQIEAKGDQSRKANIIVEPLDLIASVCIFFLNCTMK